MIGALTSACSGTRIVSVLPEQAQTRAHAAPLLLIRVDATSTQLPLAVAGASIAYGEVDRALAVSVEHATRTLSEELARRHARPLAFTVEIVDAHAEDDRGRLLVRMTVRATLRERAGNAYVAQTHAHANASAAFAPDEGGKAVLEVTDSLGGELAGFLAGLDLR